MTRIFPILGLLALAACATPQQQCQENATRDLQVLDLLIIETRQNLDRGYSVREDVVPRVGFSYCLGNYGYGSGISFCSGGSTSIRRTPVAIDLDAEAQKLKGLESRRTEVARQAQAGLAACQAQFAG
jgi:hypothetical protein